MTNTQIETQPPLQTHIYRYAYTHIHTHTHTHTHTHKYTNQHTKRHNTGTHTDYLKSFKRFNVKYGTLYFKDEQSEQFLSYLWVVGWSLPL